ncbi:MAG TPA: acyltransferase family protein [Acidimicrobiia bacterium]|jgi:peptidoglycan/LPS O-acetylase OafA/YrhL|nr:acyltransferase family protein [Acidimicrobiia bacterium]
MVVAGDVMSASPADVVKSPERPERLGYRPALDGLRAIAAGSVLLYHGGVSWSSGGFLGVDVFFVLSGFLITALLLTEWERTGGIAIISFYGRRVRRLLPALLLVIAAVALYAVVLAPTSQISQLRGDLFSTFGYFTNWRLVFTHRGYFDAFAAPSPLKHTWSLAVEEQWYLIWPIVVVGLLKLTRRANRDLRPALLVVAAACVASTIWTAIIYTPGADPSRVYYGTDTRAQELLTGAVLAFVCVIAGRYSLRSPWRGIAGFTGLVALGWTFALFAIVDDRTTWLYQGGLLLFSFAVALVILAAIQPRGVLPDVLSLGPLRWLGKISYGLYLWHWPIYVAATSTRTGLDGTPLLLLRLALTVAVSTASYYLVEAPIRHHTFRPRTLALTVPAVIAVAVTVILVTTSAAPPAAVPSAAASQVARPGGGGNLYDIFTFDPSKNPPPTTLPNDTASKLVITGDSVALTLSTGFEERTGKPPTLLWDQSVVGCSLFPGSHVVDGVPNSGGTQCGPWRAYREQWLQQFHPDVVAVFSGVWELYDRVVDGHTLSFGSKASDVWLSDQLDQLIDRLHSTGAHVALLTVPCNQRPDPVSGPEPPENDRDHVDHLNQLYREAAQRHPDSTTLIDLHGYLCPNGKYLSTLHGTDLRIDGVHLTPDGAALVRKWLFPQLDALSPRRHANPAA